MAHLVVPEWFDYIETVFTTRVRLLDSEDGEVFSDKITTTSTFDCKYGRFELVQQGKGWKINMDLMTLDKTEDEVKQMIDSSAQDARQEHNFWFAAFITRMLKNTK